MSKAQILGRRDWTFEVSSALKGIKAPVSREVTSSVQKLRLSLGKQEDLESEPRLSRSLPSGIRCSRWLLLFHKEQTWRVCRPQHQALGLGRMLSAPREQQSLWPSLIQGPVSFVGPGQFGQEALLSQRELAGSLRIIYNTQAWGWVALKCDHTAEGAEVFIILKVEVSLKRCSLYFVIS